MNINRHNYEEFFLLYVDNELPATARKTVEIFVRQNPDLQKELLLLQESILKPGVAIFEEKNALLKGEAVISELQEKLLLYLDDELAVAEKNKIESLITVDKATGKEWSLLQQTKLVPGPSVVFIDKASLYRKEGGHVMVFPWRRIAVAAILLGFGLWGTISLLKKDIPLNKDGAVTINAALKKQRVSAESPSLKSQPGIEPVTTTVQALTMPRPIPAATLSKRSNKDVEKITTQSIQLESQLVAANENNKEKPTNNLPKPYVENFKNDPGNEKIVQGVPVTEGNISIAVSDNEKLKLNDVLKDDPSKTNDPGSNNYATTVSLKENPELNNDNYIFYIKEERLKKTKLGAFFGKAKKVINKRAVINIGNRFNVGNLEFAIQ